MRRLLIVFVLLLSACGGSPATTSQQVFDRLQKAGLATNARTIPAADASTPMSQCSDRLGFDIVGASTLGVIMICPKAAGDALLAQPTAEPVVGVNVAPSIYRSAGGSAVVVVPALVPPAIAGRIKDEVALIPE